MKKLLFYIRYIFSNTLFFIQRELPEDIERPEPERLHNHYLLAIFFLMTEYL